MKGGEDPSLPDPCRLSELAWGYAAPVILATAVRHGLFGGIGPEGTTLEELRTRTGLSARGLRILLHALVGLGLLRRREERFELTPESAAYLVPGRPEYRGGLFVHHVEHLLPRWLQLPEVVRTGRPAPSPQSPAQRFAAFVDALFAPSYPAARTLQEHLRLRERSDVFRILDLGAGSGVWGIALAEGAPKVQVTAVDWPEVLAIARRRAADHGVADRFSWVEGNFFEVSLGEGHDLVVLGHILHAEGMEGVRTLLRRSVQALRPGGFIAVQEFLPNSDRTGPLHALLFAVNMLVTTEAGDTYTLDELTGCLHEAGFQAVQTLQVPAPSPLVLARKPCC